MKLAGGEEGEIGEAGFSWKRGGLGRRPSRVTAVTFASRGGSPKYRICNSYKNSLYYKVVVNTLFKKSHFLPIKNVWTKTSS